MKSRVLYQVFFSTFLGVMALHASDPVAYVTPISSYLTSLNAASGKIQKLANLGFVQNRPRTFVLSPDGATAYIGGNFISVVDTASGKLIKTITALSDPEALALNSDGSLLYGIDGLSINVYVIDTSSGELVTEVKLHTFVDDIVVAPDNSQIYLTGLYGVTVVNAQTYTVTATIRIEGEYGEVISNDGKTLYVASQNTPYLAYAVDTATNTVRAAIPDGTAGQATSVALSPDNQTLYVQAGVALVEVSTATNAVIGAIPTPQVFVSNQLAVSRTETSSMKATLFFPDCLSSTLPPGP